MKKALLLISGFLLATGLTAQEIPFEDLPEIVRQDMLTEEEEFQDLQVQDSSVINSETGYYKGSQRLESTDTLVYYKWHRIDQVWIPVHRLIKTYDDGENVICSLLQHCRPGGEWINGVMKSYTYEGGLLAEVLVQFWHGADQAWHNHFRKLFAYDDGGSRNEVVHQVWFRETQDWANKYRKVFTYFDDGNLATDTVYLCRPAEQEWHYKFLDEFFYNDAGYRTEHLTRHFVPDSALWKNMHRELFNPDEDGLVQDITVQHWCRPLHGWQNIKMVLFGYNENDLVTERRVKNWRHMEGDWKDAHRDLFSYDANGSLDTLIFQRWREGAEIWVNKELNDFEYDASGTLLSRLTRLWNPWEQTWNNFRLMKLVIDLRHLVAGTGEPSMEQEPAVALTFANPYRISTPILINGADGQVYSVKVSDMTGSLVFNTRVTSDQLFRIDRDLVPGLYVMMVTDGKKVVVSSKLLVTR